MAEIDDFSLGWESAKSLVARGVMAGLGFVGTIVFARYLDPESFGGYYFLLALIFLLVRPVQGFSLAVQKRFSEEGHPKSELVGLLLLLVGSTIVLSVILTAGTDFISDYTNVPMAAFVFVAIFGSITVFFSLQSVLKGKGRLSLATWIDTLRSILTLPLQFGFVLLGLGAAGMGYGLALATVLTVPITYRSVNVIPTLPTKDTLLSVWSYAKYSTLSGVVGEAYSRLDVLILGFLLTQAAVGQYEVALKLTLPAILLSEVVTSGLMPKVSNLHSKGGNPATDVNNALSYGSIFAIPLLFGALAMSSKVIVTVYGPQYAGAAEFLVGLSLYRLFETQSSIYGSSLSGVDRPNLNLWISSLTLVVNIVLGVGLTYYIGGIGVVYATIVSELLRGVIRGIMVKRVLSDVKFFPKPLIEQFAAGAVMFVVVWYMTSTLSLNHWWSVGSTVLLGGLLYGGLLLVFSNDLRITLRGIFRDAVGGDSG